VESRLLDALTAAAGAAARLGEAGAVAKDITAGLAGAGDGDELLLLAGSGAGDVGEVRVHLFDGDGQGLGNLPGGEDSLREEIEHLLARGLMGSQFVHRCRRGNRGLAGAGIAVYFSKGFSSRMVCSRPAPTEMMVRGVSVSSSMARR
jgi:hypothetical protein